MIPSYTCGSSKIQLLLNTSFGGLRSRIAFALCSPWGPSPHRCLASFDLTFVPHDTVRRAFIIHASQEQKRSNKPAIFGLFRPFDHRPRIVLLSPLTRSRAMPSDLPSASRPSSAAQTEADQLKAEIALLRTSLANLGASSSSSSASPHDGQRPVAIFWDNGELRYSRNRSSKSRCLPAASLSALF
jgi:hypothetical protein